MFNCIKLHKAKWCWIMQWRLSVDFHLTSCSNSDITRATEIKSMWFLDHRNVKRQTYNFHDSAYISLEVGENYMARWVTEVVSTSRIYKEQRCSQGTLRAIVPKRASLLPYKSPRALCLNGQGWGSWYWLKDNEKIQGLSIAMFMEQSHGSLTWNK